MKLSVVIVSWKVKDKLRANLEVLFASRTDFDWEVLVVDNNSGDGTAEMVKNNFPQVKLMVNSDNVGFSRANNQAINEAKGDFVLLLNPDMIVREDTLEKMTAWMEANPQAWVAGCHLVDTEGQTIANVRCFPHLADQLAVASKIAHLYPRALNKYLRKDFDYNKESKVDSIRGSFFIMRRSCLEQVGLLDERFFVWFEEVDYCRRVAEAGGEVWYTPIVQATDLVGQSFAQWPTARAQKIFAESQLKYWRKWQPRWQAWLLRGGWLAGRMIMAVVALLKIRGKAKT
jgi:GT2 family glycosyltransferase